VWAAAFAGADYKDKLAEGGIMDARGLPCGRGEGGSKRGRRQWLGCGSQLGLSEITLTKNW
jgi:hypothetical protein